MFVVLVCVCVWGGGGIVCTYIKCSGVCVCAHANVQELCENRGGCHGLPVLMNLMVSVDVKQHRTMRTHL